MVIDDTISRDINAIKKEAENIINYKDFIIEIQRMWNVKERVIQDDWSHFKITRTVTEQHTEKHEITELKKHIHIGHCAHTAISANVKVHFTGEITLQVAQTVNTEQLQHYIP